MTKEEFVEHNNIKELAIFIGMYDEWETFEKLMIKIL